MSLKQLSLEKLAITIANAIAKETATTVNVEIVRIENTSTAVDEFSGCETFELNIKLHTTPTEAAK